MGACKTKSSSSLFPQYFFNEINTSINSAEKTNNEISFKVKLTISINSVTSNNQFKVQLIAFKNSQKKEQSGSFETELGSKNQENMIKFNKFFTMVYYFEKQQPLTFNIYNGTSVLVSSVQTSLGTIMGKRQFTLKNKLTTGEEFVITASELKACDKNIEFKARIERQLKGNEIFYTISHLGTLNNPNNSLLYRSESMKFTKDLDLSKEFTPCIIPLNIVAPDNILSQNQIQFKLEDTKRKVTICTINNDVQSYINSTKSQQIHNNSFIINSRIFRRPPSFIDYLNSDMEINLTIGIDLTCSNGNPTKPSSLHYISHSKNDYEIAIKSCGEIIANYDPMQMFSVFGFGFDFKGENLSTERYNRFNFPINENTEDPRINTIDNVLISYRNFISKVRLLGPTNFSPIIKDLIRKMNDDLSQGKSMTYNILMLLTDGLIGDIQETKNALVEASFLPCSVIIIGIGNANFNSMEMLDADKVPLYDIDKRKADRDLVQFVPFNKFRHDPDKLAEEVLEEVPRQVVEYYQHRHIQPKNYEN